MLQALEDWGEAFGGDGVHGMPAPLAIDMQPFFLFGVQLAGNQGNGANMVGAVVPAQTDYYATRFLDEGILFLAHHEFVTCIQVIAANFALKRLAREKDCIGPAAVTQGHRQAVRYLDHGDQV